ncbi:MAG: efflux RND transporter periplasmic adaptor subunit [Rhodothalassiaceae bacterium]
MTMIGRPIFSFIVLPLFLLAGCGEAPSARREMPPAHVEVAPPLVKEITEWDEFTGRFVAVESVEIRSRVSGYLESIHFIDGQIVQQGDLLFIIDPRPFEAAVAREKANVAEARTRLELARKDLVRSAELLADGNISAQVHDTRVQARDAAAAALAAAEAALKAAELNLGFTRITAPTGGQISQHFISVGNLVSGGTADSTLLTRINSIDPIHVQFDADEAAYLRYVRLDRAGARTSSRVVANPVRVSLADEKGFPHQGRMDFVDNRIDPLTGTIRGRAILDNPDALMLPGMFARVRLLGKGPYDAMLLPDPAIVTMQAAKVVYVLGEDDKVEVRPVVTGPLIEGLRVIRSGITPEDRVVINGIQHVRPGAKAIPEPGVIVAREDEGAEDGGQ